MIFETQNSIYELDLEGSRIRRLTGVNNTTPRQGRDGEWRSFMKISDVALDVAVIIVWRLDDQGTIVVQGTCTSPVKTIITTPH